MSKPQRNTSVILKTRIFRILQSEKSVAYQKSPNLSHCHSREITHVARPNPDFL
jgi:hypothetical protein